MSLFSPLLVICFEPDEAQYLPDLVRALGYPDAHIVSGGVHEAVEALNSRTTSPQYLLIDIGARGSAILPDLDELAQHCDPAIRVAVVGSVNDIAFYRELKNRGVIEYFNQPVQASDVRATLIQGPVRTTQVQAQDAGEQGTVIAFMSAASGDGASTVAVNLAWCLAEEMKQSTVLVDMDYQFGLVAKSLDLPAPFGIRELLDHPDRGLDNTLVEKMLVSYGTHLRIVAAPNELRLLPSIRPEVIRDLVSILRTRFAFVILDVPHVWTDWTAAALTYADHTVLVAQLWLRSLTHASRLLTVWQRIGITQGAVSLIINRSGAKFREAVTAQDFERICHHPITSYINNDIKTVARAENHGKTVFEMEQTSPLAQQIRQIAQDLIKRYGGGGSSRSASTGDGKKKRLALFAKKE